MMLKQSTSNMININNANIHLTSINNNNTSNKYQINNYNYKYYQQQQQQLQKYKQQQMQLRQVSSKLHFNNNQNFLQQQQQHEQQPVIMKLILPSKQHQQHQLLSTNRNRLAQQQHHQTPLLYSSNYNLQPTINASDNTVPKVKTSMTYPQNIFNSSSNNTTNTTNYLIKYPLTNTNIKSTNNTITTTATKIINNNNFQKQPLITTTTTTTLSHSTTNANKPTCKPTTTSKYPTSNKSCLTINSNETNYYDEIQFTDDYYHILNAKVDNPKANDTSRQSIGQNLTNNNSNSNKIKMNCFKSSLSFEHQQQQQQQQPPPVPSSSIPTQLNKSLAALTSCYGNQQHSQKKSLNESSYSSSGSSMKSSKSSLSSVNLDKITSSLCKLKLRTKSVNKNCNNINNQPIVRLNKSPVISSGYDSSPSSANSLGFSMPLEQNKSLNSKRNSTILSFCSVNDDLESKKKYIDSLKCKQHQQLKKKSENVSRPESSTSSTSSLSFKYPTSSSKTATNRSNTKQSLADSGIFTLNNNTTNLNDSIASSSSSSSSSNGDATSNLSAYLSETQFSSPYMSTSLSSCSSLSIRSHSTSNHPVVENQQSQTKTVKSKRNNKCLVEASPFPKVKTCLIAQIKNTTANSNTTNIKKQLINQSTDSLYENLSDNYVCNNSSINSTGSKKNYSIQDVLTSLQSLETSNDLVRKKQYQQRHYVNILNKYSDDEDFLCDKEVELILNKPTVTTAFYALNQQLNKPKSNVITKTMCQVSCSSSSKHFNQNAKKLQMQPMELWEQLV